MSPEADTIIDMEQPEMHAKDLPFLYRDDAGGEVTLDELEAQHVEAAADVDEEPSDDGLVDFIARRLDDGVLTVAEES